MARSFLPVLDKCCFIIDLRTGCMVMGIVNSILTFVLAVILITFAVDLKNAAESKKDDMDGMSSVVYTIVILTLVLLFLKFLLDFIFVWAVYKERFGIVKKYYVFWIVFAVLFVVSFLKTLFHMSTGHFVARMFYLAENLYYITVIRSYLLSVNEDGVL